MRKLNHLNSFTRPAPLLREEIEQSNWSVGQICKPKIEVINTKCSAKFAINYLSKVYYERNTKTTHTKLSRTCTYT